MSEIINDIKCFSLSEVTISIAKTLRDRYRSSFWVKAEMIKLNYYTASGHCYPDLVEKKDGKVVAQLRSVMWKNDFERSNNLFQQITKEPLKDGITVMFQASVIYDPVYGLSLRIIDINPSFSLGELEKERLQTIEKLKAEGIFDLNKQLPFPLLPKRLALISVATSKGLSDFMQVIDASSSKYGIFTHLFVSLLQGDNAVETLICALHTVDLVKEYFDAVLIIRGGGGDIGLSCYNNIDLCRTVARFPLPILTGIGHSTNETVTEMVAYRDAITPTQLANLIIKCFESVDNKINELKQQLITKGRNCISREKDNIQLMDKYIRLANPDNLLNRGYSITTLNGKLLKTIDAVKDGDVIETRLANGKIKSKVIK